MTAPERDAPNPRRPPGRTHSAMPLTLASVGQVVELAAVQGGRQLQHRLAEMGLMPGARFRVLTKGRPGPFIISVKDTRLVLGYGMVHRILVCPT